MYAKNGDRDFSRSPFFAYIESTPTSVLQRLRASAAGGSRAPLPPSGRDAPKMRPPRADGKPHVLRTVTMKRAPSFQPADLGDEMSPSSVPSLPIDRESIDKLVLETVQQHMAGVKAALNRRVSQ